MQWERTVCVSLETMRTYVIKRRHEDFGGMRGMPEGDPGAEIAALDIILAGMYNKEGKESMYLVV